ncbi:Dicarboxylate transport [Pseudomonas sp. 8Z]|uniref:intermembrane phospholipid transport protein YdbH family protein n=1 Tax=Pseudomonas sp. 8Z TaxID=2653166 RepID=UPI0012F1CEAF|nr:YdbH domain-containing protein [Pseudomonas sp. 8Z]VXC75553.1 Dicarboxylate transport [Pseudomonas sp. 8Z]
MASRRLWLKGLAGLLTLLVMALAYAAYCVQHLLDEQGLHLAWRDLSPTLHGVQLENLSLQRYDGTLVMQADLAQLQLWPRWRLLLNDLQLSLHKAPSQADNDEIAFDWQPLAKAFAWLPSQIQLRRFSALLPCASGYCQLEGDLELSHSDNTLHLYTHLLRGNHSAEINGTLQGLQSSVLSARHLSAALKLDEQDQVQLNSQLQPLDNGLQWRGELSTPGTADIAWFVTWLSEWLLLDTQRLPDLPQQAVLNAQWQVQLDAESPMQQLLASPGWLNLDARLPQPWPIPALGQLSGTLTLNLINDSGSWQAHRAEGELQLAPQAAPWLADVTPGLQPGPLTLTLAPLAVKDDANLGVHLQLRSHGPLRVQGEAMLQLRQQPHWSLQMPEARLQVQSDRLDLAGNRFEKPRLNLQLNAELDAQRLAMQVLPQSRLDIERLQGDALSAQGLAAELSGLQLSGSPLAPELHGPLQLSIAALQHDTLREQGWTWQTQLRADLQTQSLQGPLRADDGLQLDLNLRHDQANYLQLDARLEELFLRAGNPLANTLADWPALLTLDNGRLQGTARLDLPSTGPLRLQAELIGQGLGGIYDRSSLSGIDASVRLALDKQHLSLQLPSLSAREINPGIALGPLHLQGEYQAPAASPTHGQINLQRADLDVLGGQLSLDAAQWDLAQPEQVLPVKLRGLDLQALFRAYPAEGLAGSGLIDGTLPVRLGQGVSIEQGHIEARTPGGQLRFDSPRIRAMGQANPGMKLVTDALEDFHYDLLSSSLDYAPSGTLRLGMRLHGQNPAIEQGRPIHFSINLEEDVPTLLASLQLTDKVSDIIQQRIQQRMRQRVPHENKE